MAFLDIVGYIAGFLVAIALTPQVIKAWKTKSTKDISIIWTLILMLGLFLWIVYGIANNLLPIMIFVSIEFLLAFSMFLLKITYK